MKWQITLIFFFGLLIYFSIKELIIKLILQSHFTADVVSHIIVDDDESVLHIFRRRNLLSKTFMNFSDTRKSTRHMHILRNSTNQNELKLMKNTYYSKKKPDDSLPVNIIEEHQEVLPYWFQAVQEGILSKAGNVTLISIDRHNHIAPPSSTTGYPIFRWPKPGEIRFLLQTSYQTILAAAVAGLIKEIVWIWPMDDTRSHREEVLQNLIHIGWVKTSESGKKLQTFCVCMYDSESAENSCFHTPLKPDTSDVVDMKASECDTQMTLKYSEIREDMAEAYLRRMLKRQAKPNKTEILLNIDEDFLFPFFASQFLSRSRINKYDLEDIDKNMARLFCPSTSAEEKFLNLYLSRFLQSITRQGNCSLIHGIEKCTKHLLKDYFRTSFMKDIEKWSQYLCKITVQQLDLYISRIVQILLSLTPGQLFVLRKIGFCLTTSHKSFQLVNPSRFTVCSGGDTSYETNTLNNAKDVGHVYTRLKTLKGIISTLRVAKPKLISVIRSTRDGYIPRKRCIPLENGIIRILNVTYGKLNLHYDENLLD